MDIEFKKFVLQLPLKEPRRSNEPETFDLERVYEQTRTGVEMIVDVDYCHKVGAATTPNSKNLRTEFREDTTGWSLASDTLHIMEMDVNIRELRVKEGGGVVIAQIHGPGKLPNMELNFKRGDLVIEDHKNARGTKDVNIGVLIKDYELGRRFNLKIVAGGGEVLFYVDGELSKTVMKSKHDGQYFKAGNYLQGQDKGNFSRVKIYSLKLSQKKKK